MNASISSRRTPVGIGLCILVASILVPSLGLADKPPQCLALENSVLAEPDWYAPQCLGVARQDRQRAPAVPNVAGDLFYILNLRNAGSFPQSFITAPLPTLTYTLLGPQTLQLFAMDFDNLATTLWAINNATKEYGTINQATGAFTVVGTVTGIALADNTTGMKFDPTGSTVYVSTATQLFTLNLTNGVATLVGAFGGAGLMIDIAISNSGQMYGHDIGADQLLTINKTTGAATPIGPTGLACNFAQGMDFDASENKLYALAYLGGGANRLAEVNLATGAFNVVATGTTEENEGAIKVPVPTTPFALGIVGGNGNLVLEPNEPVDLRPSWKNNSSAPISLTGVLSNFTGPAGPTYTLTDGTASYGTIAPGGNVVCTDCYGLDVAAATRPSMHWDATALETVSPTGVAKTWTLHIGDSFADMPVTNPFYRFVETLFHYGVTSGCGGTSYCPGGPSTREQMAVFAIVAKDGIAANPPACAPPNLFNDVPETSPFCRFIEELANRGVVSGCGGGNYCPTDPVSREQMAVFVLATLDPSLNPPACAPPNTFGDVPETSPFCRWIEELASRGVVTGCGGGAYCPTDPVTREQMGVFISLTFGLTLYGP